MVRSNEPIVWSLFSAGGVVAAFLMPIALLITAIAVPAEVVSAESLRQLVDYPLVRLFLIVLISLPMFHWAHRFRYVAIDLGLKGMSAVLPWICYGTALGVSLLAVWFAL